MAKILYGVAGEGMGHATRSKVVISHLLSKGHKIHIVSSSRAFDFFEKTLPKIPKTKISPFVLKYENNKVNLLKSFYSNINLKNTKKSLSKVKSLIEKEKPDLVITDYEPVVSYLSGFMKLVGDKKKIPLLSIDNNHISSNCSISMPKRYYYDYFITKNLSDIIVPPMNADNYIITTFFYPEVTKKGTVLVPSLLREEILNAETKDGSHILVYQTSRSNAAMFKELKKMKNEKFIVYGFNKEKAEKNIFYRKFSEKEFIANLASCKAVITNGGFTLISEALYLGKPVLSIPVGNHFEQICNALYIEKEGYGAFCNKLNTKNLSEFLGKIKHYRRNSSIYFQDKNKEALGKIDKTINQILISQKK